MKIMSPAEANKFFAEWSIYDEILARNYMHHDDIYRDVREFFAERYANRPFAILDLGCGSARHLTQALHGRSVYRYVGYDLSEIALAHAQRNLVGVNCLVELHRGDLLEGLRATNEKFDIVFTSFALHHLASSEKASFFRMACERLTDNGILLLIDTMRAEGEDRELYLERYCAWLRSRCATLSVGALDLLCDHIRNCDFPETTGELDRMATEAGFRAHLELNPYRWHHAWCFDKAGLSVRE